MRRFSFIKKEGTISSHLLSIKNLKVQFHTPQGVFSAVDDLSFDVFRGEILGLVGESGSGKSVTALSILRLLSPPGEISSGNIFFQPQSQVSGEESPKKDLLALSPKELQDIRGRQISMVFQEPMTALNPVLSIKTQMMEVLTEHGLCSPKEACARSVELLGQLGLGDPQKRIHQYPHQFSGGMRQRVMIAMAILAQPKLLIADEPTTALDVTIQAQILDLLLRLKENKKVESILFITHDLNLVSENCDRVIVLYGGVIQEQARVNDLFQNPKHPYTKGLLRSIPRLEKTQKRLSFIEGSVPDLFHIPRGCKFWPRCELSTPQCQEEEPELRVLNADHGVRCHLL